MPEDDAPERDPPRRAFLFGLREDGSPTCHPMVAIEDGGAILFNTYRSSAKARNFLRDPRAAVLLLPDWQAGPDRAEHRADRLEPDAPPPVAEDARGVVPAGVADRVRRRVAEGKRIGFRLKPR